MWKVGITGGIGSGKTIVARVFETLGIPVFNADDAAKMLMQEDTTLQQELIAYFGNEIYDNGRLNRPLLSSIVFAHPEKLAYLNSRVHPRVRAYGLQWHLAQTTPYSMKEAALFFESGSYTDMDIMIGVSAPLSLRLSRATNRDRVSEQKILDRMAQQMDEQEKMSRCDYVIINDNVQSILEQVQNIHQLILQK